MDDGLILETTFLVDLERDRADPAGRHRVWIAATAVTFRKPIVTRNVREYHRVPGIEVIDYRAP